jgi:hypothetical protein
MSGRGPATPFVFDKPGGGILVFKTALKDFKREGRIGLQDRGANVQYRNARIRALD